MFGFRKKKEQEEPKSRAHELSGSMTAIFIRRFRRNKAGILGLIIVASVFFLALSADFLSETLPFVYKQNDLFYYYVPSQQPPGYVGKNPFTGETNFHLLGTDRRGRDILTQIIYGSRITVMVAVFSTLISLLIGTPLGLVAGYAGGKSDEAIMRITDLFLTLPFYFVIIAFIVALQNNEQLLNSMAQFGIKQREAGLVATVIGLGVFGWMSIARVVRAEVLKLRDATYIEAARCLGTPTHQIIFRHLIPNVLPPLIVVVTYLMATNILAEAGIAYLGLGDPNIPSWGREISEGQTIFSVAPWISIFSGLAIIIAVLGFNLVGDGIRDATDPKLKR